MIVNIEDFLYKVDLFAQIEEAKQQIAAGDVIPHEEIEAEFRDWLQ
jgi:predicted transcriptional regulator